MNRELKELLEDLKKWIESSSDDEIDKNYGIWELNYNQSKELLNYIDNLKQALIDIREYVKEKQKIQGKFALSHIECDDILEIIEKILGGSDENDG